MEYFRWTISVEGHKSLYIARKGAFIITLPSDWENFRETEGRERKENERKRSHRKPNTMVIRGESAWVLRGYQFHPPSTEDPIQPPSPSLSPSYPPVARHWKFIELSQPPPPSLRFPSSPRRSLDLIGDRLFDILIIRLFDCHRGSVWFRESIARRRTKNRHSACHRCTSSIEPSWTKLTQGTFMPLCSTSHA